MRSAIAQAVAASVWPMIAANRVRPVIGTRLPIQQAAQAHELMLSGKTFGKILLTV